MKRDLLRHRLPLGLVLVIVTLVTFGFPKVQARRNGLVVSTGRAFKVSYDRGGVWQNLSAKFARGRIHQVRQRAGGRLLAATRSGLFAGDPSGSRWGRLLPEETFAAAEGRNKIFAGTRRGLLMSDDEGDNWRRVEALAEGVVPRTIEVAPGDERTLYVGTDRHGVFASFDGGDNWRPVNKGLPRSIGAAPVTPVLDMAVDPRDGRVAYAASEVHGIYKTTDGGQEWQAVNQGLPVPFYYRTYSPLIEISPENADLIYAVMGKPVDSGRITNGLYKTVNGGKHWIELTGLKPNLIFRSLTINPNDSRELFIAHEDGVIEFYDDPRWDVLVANAPTDIQAINQDQRCDRSKPSGRVSTDSETRITLMEADKCLFHEFDQEGKTIQFLPFTENGQFGGYDVSYTDSPFKSAQGSPLALTDDATVEVPLPFPFPFYGLPQTSVFVNSNGNLTFGSGDPDPFESELKFVTKQPRISGLWNDMNPARFGTIFYTGNASEFIVTWLNVPEVTPDKRLLKNTFQLSLFPDGRILIKYQEMASLKGLVGISPGGRDRFYQNFTKIFEEFQQPILRFSRDFPIGELFVEGLYYPEVSKRFYMLNDDEYDILVIYGDPQFSGKTITGLVDPTGELSMLISQWVKNDIEGIGVLTFDTTDVYKSKNKRLRMVVNMDRISQYFPDPLDEDYQKPFDRIIGPKSAMDILAQMVGHAWAAYVSFDDGGIVSDEIRSGTERGTWSFFFNTNASLMDGNTWESNERTGRFRTTDANYKYSLLDQYLMGLVSAGEMTNQETPAAEKSFFLIKDPINAGGRTRGSIPEVGVSVQGTKHDVRIEDIIRVEGAREPPKEKAQKKFTLGFIYVYPKGAPGLSPHQLGLGKLDRFRCCFEFLFYERFTDKRGQVTTGCSPERATGQACGL